MGLNRLSSIIFSESRPHDFWIFEKVASSLTFYLSNFRP